MSEPNAPPPLIKHRSWSPATVRDEAWSRRKRNHNLPRCRRCQSVTDDDLDELKACFELGFSFDSPDVDQKLTEVFPALELYNAVSKQHSKGLSRSSSSPSTLISESDSSISIGSPSTLLDSGDDPEMMKARLRQWAQVVGCVVRQSSPN